MIAIIAKLKPAAGKEPEFEAVMADLAAAVRANEPGNKLYTLTKDAEGNYLMLELYEDEASLAAHGKSEHFKTIGGRLGGMMAGRPEITRLEVIA